MTASSFSTDIFHHPVKNLKYVRMRLRYKARVVVQNIVHCFEDFCTSWGKCNAYTRCNHGFQNNTLRKPTSVYLPSFVIPTRSFRSPIRSLGQLPRDQLTCRLGIAELQLFTPQFHRLGVFPERVGLPFLLVSFLEVYQEVALACLRRGCLNGGLREIEMKMRTWANPIV